MKKKKNSVKQIFERKAEVVIRIIIKIMKKVCACMLKRVRSA